MRSVERAWPTFGRPRPNFRGVVCLIAASAFATNLGCTEKAPETSRQLTIPAVEGVLINNSPAVGDPSAVALQDSTLWVVDAAGDPALHALSVRTPTQMRSFGRKGGGPGEFIGGIGAISASDSGVWAFDGAASRLTEFSIRSDSAIRVTKLTATPPPFKAVWLTNSTGLGITGDPQRRFLVFDDQGHERYSKAGAMLGPDSIDLPARVRSTVTMFSVCANPSTSKIAIAYGDAGRIEVYDTTFAKPLFANVPNPGDPTFIYNPSKKAWSFHRDRMSYFSCAATKDRIYALYSGIHFDKQNLDNARHADVVEVFDWNGGFIRSFRINPGVMGITVNASGDTLYGVSVLTAGVYRYVVNGR